MKYRLMMAILICVALFVSGPALASEPFCVSFAGLSPQTGAGPPCDGDATLAYEYHHMVSRDLQGGTPGPIRHNQVIITREWDNITPQLWQLIDAGTSIQNVTFQFPLSGGGPVQFEIRLSNVHILAIEPLIPHVRDSNPYGNQSRIRMSYQTLSIQYENEDAVVLQNQQGG